jgi:class 3 adenylate cyclase
MNPTPPWYRVVSDRSVLRRAAISALGVGTILTIVNQGDRITAGSVSTSALLPIGLTYVVPFLVSLASSVIAVRVARRGGAATNELLEREIQAINRFPGQNPNPVMRIAPDGALSYANDASASIRRALGVQVGDPLPPAVLDALRAAMSDPTTDPVEVAGEGRTFRLKPVAVPEFDFTNLYGTDVTAEKAIDRFPNQNPNPVLRLTHDGRMTYANPASALVRKALAAEVGQELDRATFARVVAALENTDDPTMEVEADGTIYQLRVVSVYEFASINLYGTDITAARQLQEVSRENERLLLNILPGSIAARLRTGETVIADGFDDMAVLFADLVGFTELSSHLAPTDVVRLLNDVFSTFDRLTDRFGLEKIKTIGDAYMVVGGLADRARGDDLGSHAGDVADMGLAIIDELSRFEQASGTGLQVRVGMHVGPAVAGVIGLKKFIYDVWGDTVNTASRMETTGLPGRLQVTRETHERLGDGFDFERRGIVDVKGKGPIETWFVLGRRSSGAETGAQFAATTRAD